MDGKSDRILKVPYYSQFQEIKNEEWKSRACSIVCLKMAFDFLLQQSETISNPSNSKSDFGTQIDADELFKESEEIQQSLLSKKLISEEQAKNGRTHDTLVFLTHNHGLPAYKEEFKSLNLEFSEKMFEFGISKISKSIENEKPVLVSVLPGLSEGKSFHTILIVGTQKENEKITGFYYHDPDAKNERLENQFLNLENFKKFWRRLTIFVG